MAKLFKTNSIEITSIGIDKDKGLFIINRNRFIATSKKNLESLSAIISGNGNDIQIIYEEITDEIREVKCHVQLKNNAIIITINSEEIHITDCLYDTFRLIAFINTLLSEDDNKKILQIPKQIPIDIYQ